MLFEGLENESNALAKRMSAASIYEDYTSESFASNGAYYSRDNMSTPTSQLSKPSAIPRPSMQHSRTADFSTSSHETSSRPGSVKRSRTFSQPVPFEPPLANGTPYPPIDITSRANSPTIAAKNTRIPISRNRTGSISSYKQPSLNGSFGRADGTNGIYKANGHLYSQPEPMPELWPVTESQQFGSHSTLKTHITQTSELVNEPSPFVSSISSHIYEHDYAAPRMSTDSEERPFEHWYRGDVSRNGGVGELRVGRKQEMLDIANYGHTLRQASSRTAIDTSSRSRSNSRGRETVNPQVRNRPRAGSVPGRESIYIDTQTPHDSMVLDERPPTDFDSDGEHYDDQDDGDYMDEDATTRAEYSREHEGVASPLSFDRSDTPTTLVDKTSAFKSRIPTPTPRQISESPSTPAQSPQLGTTESSPATYKATKSSSQPPSPARKLSPATGSASAKRRAKAPVVAASTTKKTRTKSPAKPVKRNRDNEDRRSVAHYPSLEGDDVVHAIPSWTQPVPSSGNWDDVGTIYFTVDSHINAVYQVVLPVVARKKGLEGQYEHADGSPKPKPTNTVIEPVSASVSHCYIVFISSYRVRRPGHLDLTIRNTDHHASMCSQKAFK